MLSLLDWMKGASTRAQERQSKPGADHWCRQCGRRHRRRQVCDLSLRTRETRGKMEGVKGKPRPRRKVQRWAP